VHRLNQLNTDSLELDRPRIEDAWGSKLRNKKDFLEGRDGDSLLIPFECDQCIFLKLRSHLPDSNSTSDTLLMATIRRLNLDAFWSRERSTVSANLSRVKRMINISATVGLDGPFPIHPPFPLHDHCGYQVAINMLLFSRRPGVHDPSYTQYDTIRGYRASYSNFTRAASINNRETRSLGDFNGNYQRLVLDECGSLFFKRFTEGLRNRMGQLWKPNLAMSIPLLKYLIFSLENKLEALEDSDEQHIYISTITYIIVSYVISLRGPEGFLLDLEGLNKHLNYSSEYSVITLRGRLKGEQNDSDHLIPCSNVTSSGINVKGVLNRLIEFKRSANQIHGPAISNCEGKILSAKLVDDIIHESLIEILETAPDLFPPTIVSSEKILTSYQCFRTFRRTSATRATEQGVSSSDTDVVNRWKTNEGAKGKRPNVSMRQHYTQLDLLLQPFLRYTRAM